MARGGILAMSALLDSDTAHRNAVFAAIKRRFGACGAPEFHRSLTPPSSSALRT